MGAEWALRRQNLTLVGVRGREAYVEGSSEAGLSGVDVDLSMRTIGEDGDHRA